MSDKTVSNVQRITGIVLSVLCLLCAVALVIACVCIYRSGDRPFTPESIGKAWGFVAIFVWLFVLCAAAAGIWHVCFPPQIVKQKGIVFPELRLAKVKARLGRKQYPDELLLPLVKHEIYLKSMRITAIAICMLSAAYPLIYLSNQDNFTSVGDLLNKQVTAAVLPALCYAAAALGYCYAVRLLSDISCERALIYAKAIMLLPAPAAEKKPEGKHTKALPRYAIIVARVALIAVAVLMIIFGIFNGGMNDVLQKAIKICTECIGLG